MKDITNKSDIKRFVDAFYKQAVIDPLLGPVFAAAIQADEWQVHMERIYNFWNAVLFSVPDYKGNAFSKHRDLPLQKQHFDRWIQLFAQTLDTHFEGPKTEEAKERAVKMGELFLSKLNYLRDNPQFKNLM